MNTRLTSRSGLNRVGPTRWIWPVLVVVPWLATTLHAAEVPRPTPRCESETIPSPPEQGKPWTPPETRLPGFLVRATAALFEQGMADPRGCEYREVELGDATLIQTRGFVLPAASDDEPRFAVGWDGIVRPAFTVGPPGDLDADIRSLAETMRRDRERPKAEGSSRRLGGPGFLIHGGHDPGGAIAVEDRSPRKVCLLLRFGRADLAEALFAAGTAWTPEAPRPDLTDYGISYLTLARHWTDDLYQRAILSHTRADDVVALDALRRLAAFRKAAEAHAEALGFPRIDPRVANLLPRDPSYFSLPQLSELLADQERRAKEPPRGPIPPAGDDPTARITALIRDLDEIAVHQMSVPGSAHPGNSPVVRDLVAMGDPAVPSLLEVLESDNRLTRSASLNRGRGGYAFVHPVHQAALSALWGILKTRQIPGVTPETRLDTPEGRQQLARAIRAYWERVRTVSMIERWYRALADDEAGEDRWLEAAAGLVQPADEPAPPRSDEADRRRRPGEPPAMKGEPLRDRRDPSITELMAHRADQIYRPGTPGSNGHFDLKAACRMGRLLAKWDERAALPTLRQLSARCRELLVRPVTSSTSPGKLLANLTRIRAEAGDRAALDEYAAWIRTTDPKSLDSYLVPIFEPLWLFSDHPAIADAARWLFQDPESPWVPLVIDKLEFWENGTQGLLTSPLIGVAGFRAGVIQALADQTRLGTITRSGPETITIDSKPDGSRSTMTTRSTADVEEGVAIPLRQCDFIAWRLSTLDGTPAFELFWPEARRDETIKSLVAFLNRYGAHYSYKMPTGQSIFPHRNTYPRLPILDHPATAEDVREGRAIFSLEGQGEARLVPLPARPIRARWVTLKDYPYNVRTGAGEIQVAYDQDGWVWQAEEVGGGGHSERFYGFVGRYVIARVPATEIELDDEPYRWGKLTSGLDARVALDGPPTDPHEPGQPILATVHLRNRRGTDQTAPTEFLRATEADRPALRRGVAPSLAYLPPESTRPGSVEMRGWEELEPTRTDRFDPDEATRSLGPAEEFEAFRIELADWFDLSRPGRYRLHFDFSDDSGVGQGHSNDLSFQVGDPRDAGE